MSVDNTMYDFNQKVEYYDRNSEYNRLESDQRDNLLIAVERFSDNDIIVLSDLDEIPNKYVFEHIDDILGNDDIISLSQDYFYYGLKNRFVQKWALPVVTRKSTAVSMKMSGLRSAAIDKKTTKVITNGGWHLSYFMSPEKIKEKIQSFSHVELDNPYHNDLNRIKSCIENRVDLFERDVPIITAELDDFPDDFWSVFGKYY